MSLTLPPDQLAHALQIPVERAELWTPHLAAATSRFSIDTPQDLAAFVAQSAHESQRFTHLRENLNYSATGLFATFPSRFTAEQAKEYERQPERIANHAYAGKYGNGDEASGDGWKFRGGGLFGLTFRGNYKQAGEDLELPLEAHPELVTDPLTAALTAGWFWDANGLNGVALEHGIDAVTKTINPGMAGKQERADFYSALLNLFQQAEA